MAMNFANSFCAFLFDFSGQNGSSYFTNLDTREIRGPISRPKFATFWGEIGPVRARANLTIQVSQAGNLH